MLTVIAEKSAPTCVVAECGGKITAEEYAAYLPVLQAAVKAGDGRASAVFIVTATPMDADWDAFKDDWSFGTHDYRELSRVAYVGDEAWLRSVTKMFGWMTKAEEKTFPADEADAAVAWACGS